MISKINEKLNSNFKRNRKQMIKTINPIIL